MPFGNGRGPYWQRQRGGQGRFGRGRGRGRMFRGQPSFSGQAPQAFNQPVSKEQELELLKQQSQQLKQQLDIVLRRIDEAGKGNKQEPRSQELRSLKAFIDESKCTACGMCANICPQGAIMVNNLARVNMTLCIGCGACVGVCPNKTIFLRRI
ncbi:MAG: 4Fe-4S binding protein [Candidatus Omnitrophica bacterium]|nr:4Fe-4S binding protein [Candidatus Omnitrophota bacterium]